MNTLEQIYKPGHIAPLSTFRVLFGILLFFHALSFFFNDSIHQIFYAPGFFFSAYGLDWVRPLPYPGMYILFGALALLGLMISAGYYFRLSSILFVGLYAYVSSIDRSQASQFSNFYLLTTFFLALLPSHRYFSLDILRNPSLRVDYIPRWCIWVIKLQVAFLFFNAGLAKLNHDWLFLSEPFTSWIHTYWGDSLIGRFFTNDAVAMMSCWGIVIVEFLGPVAMFFSLTKTKVYIFLSIYLLGSFLLLPTGFMPFQIILLSTVFLNENKHHNITSRIAYFLNDFFQFNPKVFRSGRNLMLAYKNKLIIPLFFTWIFGLLIISNISLFVQDLEVGFDLKPLRISDKLIINNLQGSLRLFVHGASDSNQQEINLKEYLTENQIQAVSVNPDLLMQYVRYLKKENKMVLDEVSIYAVAAISRNGKDFQPFINPKINLATYKGSTKGLLLSMDQVQKNYPPK